MTSREIREEYPQLTEEDIQAALAYVAELTDEITLAPLPTYPEAMAMLIEQATICRPWWELLL